MKDQAAQLCLPQQSAIDAYGNGGFRFAGMSHKGSILTLPSGMYAWDFGVITDLSLEQLAPILAEADQLDVFLLGTGVDLWRPDEAVFQAFRDQNIIFDCLSTGSAARTYNVMIGEQRAVGCGLVAIDG